MDAMDPDPAKIPDVAAGGGVPPGATPPDAPQTSGLSAPEPRTRHHFPVAGVVAVIITAVLVVVFVPAAIGIVVPIF
ncbi:DUF6480 family protein [Nocardia sp. NPDC049220]|uniref:DUF6480 family protein n=1 Tax=Nocardia sp. NPDC049220 TaxID=3155273 RepID=UPI0033FF3884